MTRYTLEDAIISAAQQLMKTVQGMIPKENKEKHSLQKLSDLFQQISLKKEKRLIHANKETMA